MKIIFFVPSLCVGGMERVLVNYANLLSKKGHDITVCNLTSHDNAIVKNFSSKIIYKHSYVPVPNIIHAKLKDILLFNFRILPMRLWIKFHTAKYINRKYIKEKYDCEIGFAGIITFKIVSGANNIKSIGWVHGMDIEKEVGIVGDFKKTQLIYNSLNAIICVSSLCMQKVKKTFGVNNNVFVLNNPNDSKKIRALATEPIKIKKENFTFVTVARFIDEQKGFFRLLNVCKRLNEDGFKYNVWLVGDGKDFLSVKDAISKMNLNNIVLFGMQENPYKYIANSDMYLGTSYTEGFSMVMMEAIILGKPMLTTNVPGAKEMLDNGKFGIIVENSKEGLYDGMKHVLSHSYEYDLLVKKADQRKDYLDESSIIANFESIVSKI